MDNWLKEFGEDHLGIEKRLEEFLSWLLLADTRNFRKKIGEDKCAVSNMQGNQIQN
jgi:hypothetical protein